MARKHPTRLIVVALALLTGCTAGTPAPEQLLHISGQCGNEGGLVEDDSKRSEGSLSGDVDGDGTVDEVYIAADRAAPLGCASFLVVRLGLVKVSAPIDPSGTPRSLEIPTLNSLADIDDQPGHEVVVNVEMGASTQFVAVFGLLGNAIHQLQLKGKPPGPFAGELGDLFPFGGSVGHLEAIDCTADGYVVMSAAMPVGDSADSYEVERRFFVPESAELVLEKDLTENVTVEGLKIDDFPEFGGSPFGSCD